MITLVESVRPSEEQIREMWRQNPKGGGGVAWRDVASSADAERLSLAPGSPVVRWRKGLNEEEMLEQNRILPIPYVLHFRQPSNDTSESLLACHPFQIDADATTGFEGVTPGWVLFHNGFWSEWRRKLEALAIAGYGSPGFKGLPSGAWSDSRGLAWATHYLNFGFLEMVNEKVLCLGPGDLDIEMFGGPWLSEKAPGSDQSFVVSNVTWRHIGFTTNDRRHQGGRGGTAKVLDAAKDITTGKAGGTSHQDPFPCSHGPVARATGTWGDQQKHVQETAQGDLQADVRTLQVNRPLGGRTCGGCHKSTSAGMFLQGVWSCWQCWSKRPDKAQSGSSEGHVLEGLWVGTCQRCRAGASGMKTLQGDEWICMTCWETTGRPHTYYARQRTA